MHFILGSQSDVIYLPRSIVVQLAGSNFFKVVSPDLLRGLEGDIFHTDAASAIFYLHFVVTSMVLGNLQFYLADSLFQVASNSLLITFLTERQASLVSDQKHSAFFTERIEGLAAINHVEQNVTTQQLQFDAFSFL